MMTTSYSARGSGEVHCLSQPLCPRSASRATAKTEYFRIRHLSFGKSLPLHRPYKSQIQLRHNVSFATQSSLAFDTARKNAAPPSRARTFKTRIGVPASVNAETPARKGRR
jgi:hypothetical protein